MTESNFMMKKVEMVWFFLGTTSIATMKAMLIRKAANPVRNRIAYHPYCDFQNISAKVVITVSITDTLIIHSLPSQSLSLISKLEIAYPKKYMEPNKPI